MRAPIIAALFTATYITLAANAQLTKLNAQSLARREVLARDAALATLPPHIQDDLARRDPSEYELDLSQHLERDLYGDDEDISKWMKRESPTGPGLATCQSDNFISMTYDDGPFDYEKQLTKEYVKAGMKLTYFINVNNFGCAYTYPRPENLQYALSKGMVIGSHSGTHPDFTTLTIPQIDEQIQIVENFTWATLGILPRFFRPPYGSTTKEINDHLSSKWGLTVVTWALDAGDADNATPAESVARIKATTGGEIVLNHETHETSITQVAPAVINNLQKKGSKSVSVAKCLKTKPYKARLNNNKRKRTDKWTCAGLPAPGKSNV